MISFIEGKIALKNDKFFTVEIGGIGFKIFTHDEVLKKLPAVGEKIRVFTHLYMHEDARRYMVELYGFLNKEELHFFELLISISGIGPRSALAVLSRAPVNALKRAIVSEDESFFTKVSGIGKKTAQKLIFELKTKLSKEVVPDGGFKEIGDAFEALVSLGYKQADVRKVLNELPKNLKTVEEKVKEALKRLARK